MPLALAPQVAEQQDALAPRPEAQLAPGLVIRRLEGTERLAGIGNAVHEGNFNVVASIELEGPVTHHLLVRALEEVQREYECLRVEVVRELGTRDHYVFRLTHERPRLEVTHEDWRAVWDRLTNESIHGLAWKVVWTGGHLVVAAHHAITDAVSLSVFFDRLLETMARTAQGVLEIPPSRPMPPPMHVAARSQWPTRAIARIGAQRFFGGLTTGPLVAAEPRERRWYSAFRTYEVPHVQRLLDRCRAEGVTFTHALSAAAALEMAGRVKSKQPFTVALCTSIDLRRLIPGIDSNTMGLMSSAVHSFFPIKGGEKLWPLAGQAKAQLDRAFRRNEHRDMPQMHRLIGARTAAWLESDNSGRPRDASVLVSNVGRLDCLDHGTFKAKGMFVTGQMRAFGNTYILVAATVGGRLCLHLGFPTPTISAEEGEGALDRMMARLG
ncbi:MAG: hypothetical protein IPJ65_38640 [Archangiaceae bacterium]|nr:hypothetical protein [Archangiaceae bacterium]